MIYQLKVKVTSPVVTFWTFVVGFSRFSCEATLARKPAGASLKPSQKGQKHPLLQVSRMLWALMVLGLCFYVGDGAGGANSGMVWWWRCAEAF